MPKLDIEATARRRSFMVSPITAGTRGKVTATVYRVNLAGVKGSVAALWPRLWVEKHSSLGKRLMRNTAERHAIMAQLPFGDTYEWIWF